MPNNPAPVQEWTFQEAEERFAEVFRLARTQGPQRISSVDGGSVLVIPAEAETMPARQKSEETFGEFLARSPLAGSGVDLTRDPDVGRDIDW